MKIETDQSLDELDEALSNELPTPSLEVRGPYKNKRARKTLEQLSREGQLLVEYELFERLRDEFDLVPERDNKSVYSPGELFDRLKQYSFKPELKCDEALLRDAFNITLSHFGTKDPNLVALPLDESIYITVDGKKQAGAPTFRKKEEAFHSDLERAIRTGNDERAPDPCVAFHRVQHGETGPKTRLVWGYPQSMTLLEARFARPLIDHYMVADTAIAFGGRKCDLYSRMSTVRNSPFRYEFDFSGFDSSIATRLIGMAFTILKTHFVMSEEDELHWNKVVWYFINTPIVMPDGITFVKHHGVPSGSYFTQLVDSVVNYLALQYSFLRMADQKVKEGHILVLGDDVIVGFHKPIAFEDFAPVLKELGLNLNVEKSRTSRFPESVHFLGREWNHGVTHRTGRDLAMRIVFPEKPSGITDGRVRQALRPIAFAGEGVESHLVAGMLSDYKGRYALGRYVRRRLNDPDWSVTEKDLPGFLSWLASLNDPNVRYFDMQNYRRWLLRSVWT